ncbi:hypothetical protein ACIPPN_03510 [Streptomyces diastaticus]|uniref:hypothetical protein n=1 Tax=Streptomyces diastaticus TaxID=1956 RepID=UPI00382C05A3
MHDEDVREAVDLGGDREVDAVEDVPVRGGVALEDRRGECFRPTQLDTAALVGEDGERSVTAAGEAHVAGGRAGGDAAVLGGEGGVDVLPHAVPLGADRGRVLGETQGAVRHGVHLAGLGAGVGHLHRCPGVLGPDHRP